MKVILFWCNFPILKFNIYFIILYMQLGESISCWWYIDVFKADHSELDNLSDDSSLERIDLVHLSCHSLHVALHLGVGPCEISTITLSMCRSCLHNDVFEISFTWHIYKTLLQSRNLVSLALFNLSKPVLWCFLSFMCKTDVTEVSTQDGQPNPQICGYIFVIKIASFLKEKLKIVIKSQKSF